MTTSAEHTKTLKVVKPAQVGMWEIHPQTGDVAYDGVSAQLLGIGTEAGHSTVTQHLNGLIHPATATESMKRLKNALRTQTTCPAGCGFA